MKQKLQKHLIPMTIICGLSIFGSQNSFARSMSSMSFFCDNTRTSYLERMDYDNDGIVTVEDLLTPALDKADRYFNVKDRNNDSVLSLTEYSNQYRPFTRLDQDALQQCINTASEQAGLPVYPTQEQAFSDADSNSDNQVDSLEYQAYITIQTEERFAFYDLNADQMLSEDELDFMSEARTQSYQIKRDCIREQRVWFF